jgi:excisionase family DNA binding protein
MNKDTLTVQEVAASLRVSRQMVYNMIRKKELASFKIGSAVRIQRIDLDRYIEQQKRLSQASLEPAPEAKKGLIQISHLSVNIGGFYVSDIDLEFPLGSSLGVIGPSGSGKTLLLRCLAGLQPPLTGHFLVDGELMDHLGPGMRRVGFVFQDYSLYPHMAPRGNIGFPKEIARAPHKEVEESVTAIATRLGIGQEYLDRGIGALPEGIKQLVAIGRAENRSALLFVMDEPLVHLDAGLRRHMRAFLGALRKDLGVSTIYAFNNAEDTLALSDYILCITEGRALRFGRAEDVWADPGSLEAMEMLSANGVNRLGLRIRGGRADLGGIQVPPGLPDGDWLCCFRPEETEQVPEGQGLEAEIMDARLHDGQSDIANGMLPDGRPVSFIVPSGTRGTFRFSPANPRFFPAGSEAKS